MASDQQLTKDYMATIGNRCSEVQSHANRFWTENRKQSKIHADRGNWVRSCHQALAAGASMAAHTALTVDYMAVIGQRCTEASR